MSEFPEEGMIFTLYQEAANKLLLKNPSEELVRHNIRLVLPDLRGEEWMTFNALKLTNKARRDIQKYEHQIRRHPLPDNPTRLRTLAQKRRIRNLEQAIKAFKTAATDYLHHPITDKYRIFITALTILTKKGGKINPISIDDD